MPKQARLSGIKSLRSYTMNEAAEVSGVSPRTICNWVTKGLEVMDQARPILIRGDVLRDFIKEQRASRKVEVSLDAFFCFRCRVARKAAGGFADCKIVGHRATLHALCDTCETLMSKPIAERCIPEIARTLELTITRP